MDFINYCNSESREVGIAPVLGTGELRRFESCLSDIVMIRQFSWIEFRSVISEVVSSSLAIPTINFVFGSHPKAYIC